MRQIIPDVRARTAVLTLSTNYKTLTGTLGEMQNSAGSTEEAYKKMADTIANKFKDLRNEISAAVLKSESFKTALDEVTKSSGQAAEGIGKLAASAVNVSGRVLTGYGALASFNSAMWELNDVTLELSAAQKKAEERLQAVNQATGLNIKSSKEMFELLKLGVIEYDKQSGAITANTLNLDLYKKGVLHAGQAGQDFVKISQQTTDDLAAIGDEIAANSEETTQAVADEMAAVADEMTQLADKTKTAGSTISADLAAIGDEIVAVGVNQKEALTEMFLSLARLAREGKSETDEYKTLMNEIDQLQKEMAQKSIDTPKEAYKIRLADLKLALAQEKISQSEFNSQMLALNKQHWADEVKILTDSLAETKRKLDAGEIEYKEYETAVLALREAQTKLAGATTAADTAMSNAGDTAAGATKKYATAAERLGLTADQALEVKYRLGELKRPADAAGDALIEAGRKGENAAAAAEISWADFADQVNVSVGDLKQAVKEVTAEMAAAQRHMEEWRLQTKRKTFSSSVPAELEKFVDADATILQAEISRQQKIIYSFSKWISPEQKVKARKVLSGLNELLRKLDSNGYATGGKVPGSGTGDTVPAMLTPGEIVLPVPVLKSGRVAEFLAGLKYQLPMPQINLPQINLPKMQYFATGGQVQPTAPTETINVNLNVGGQQFPGTFERETGLEFINALESAQMAMS